ncbi:MAG: MazG nucleotide pyrophosphohydrolase domain-containing protein [Acutalibacter sp.]|jgi:NTP pyrophosphatase (non-canonical NTP hydrolase)
MDTMQKKTAKVITQYALEKDPQVRMLDLSSEVGELAKEILKSTEYGTHSLKVTASLEEELGDCLFSLLCLSEALGLDGESALDKVLEKYRCRFGEQGTIDHYR